jgi:hypothetical protein
MISRRTLIGTSVSIFLTPFALPSFPSSKQPSSSSPST